MMMVASACSSLDILVSAMAHFKTSAFKPKESSKMPECNLRSCAAKLCSMQLVRKETPTTHRVRVRASLAEPRVTRQLSVILKPGKTTSISLTVWASGKPP